MSLDYESLVDVKFVGKVEDRDWPHNLYIVFIKEFTFEYKMGLGCKGKPKIKDILDVLFSDADCGCEQMSLLEFCNEFGYDLDSFSTIERYLACIKTYQKLREVFKGDYEDVKERVRIDVYG